MAERTTDTDTYIPNGLFTSSNAGILPAHSIKPVAGEVELLAGRDRCWRGRRQRSAGVDEVAEGVVVVGVGDVATRVRQRAHRAVTVREIVSGRRRFGAKLIRVRRGSTVCFNKLKCFKNRVNQTFRNVCSAN